MASTEELVELLVDGARYGEVEEVQKALDAKVDVNAEDEWGKTGACSGAQRLFAPRESDCIRRNTHAGAWQPYAAGRPPLTVAADGTEAVCLCCSFAHGSSKRPRGDPEDLARRRRGERHLEAWLPRLPPTFAMTRIMARMQPFPSECGACQRVRQHCAALGLPVGPRGGGAAAAGGGRQPQRPQQVSLRSPLLSC